MSKKKAILAAVVMLFVSYGMANAVSGPFGYDLQKDMHRSGNKQGAGQQQEQQTNQTNQTNQTSASITVVTPPKSAKDYYSFVPFKDLFVESIDNSSSNYVNPTLKSAISRYKEGNYTGSLQELYAYIRKNPNDPYAYYYMGLAYTKVGENDAAKNCFQKTINCNVSGKLLDMALKGRDCITGGEFCKAIDTSNTVSTIVNSVNDDESDLDKFIKAPYAGNGFSPELQQEYTQKRLENLQKTINRKDSLNEGDIETIKNIQKNKSEAINGERLAMSANISEEPSNAEILDAIDVLKRAGLNISAESNSAAVPVDTTALEETSSGNSSSFTPPQEYQQINMLLGNDNNNNDPMMTMLPYMMNSNSNGQNVDPQVVQALMMNSMMNSVNNMGMMDNNK